MTAEQCLGHEWLRRRAPPAAPPMDITKDNLREFVERWNEHPNSPYVFEMTNHMVCRGGTHLSDSLHSLTAMSPSPCGSVCSLESEGFEQPKDEGDSSKDGLLPPNLDHLRRASDSTCVVKGQDVTERINLADEIKKLSDKLFQLSTMAEVPDEMPSFKEFNLPVINTPEPLKTNLIKDPNNCVLPKDHPLNVNCGVPWRKPKNRINNMSRDVPLAPKFSNNSLLFGSMNESESSSPNDTKDLLLKLLEHWDGPQGPARVNPRHASFSSEWTESDSLGQKTISSLNTFFQSRAALKKVTPFRQN